MSDDGAGSAPTISVEHFASLRAAMESVPDVEAFLGAAGFSREAWRSVSKSFVAAFTEEVRLGRRELAARYLEAYLRAVAPEPPIQMDPALEATEVPLPLAHDETLAPADSPPVSLPFAKRGATPPEGIPLPDPSGQTVGPDSIAPRNSLPFARASHALMSLDRYAALAAELRACPAEAEAVMTRFGLETREQRERVHALWRVRFESNPSLRTRFDETVSEKFAELSGETRRSR